MGCTTAPHALRPGLLHAAEEASRDHGPEQAVAVTACIPGHSFSGITRAFALGVCWGFMGSWAAVQTVSQKHGTQQHRAFGRSQRTHEIHRMVVRAIPVCLLQRAWAQRETGENLGI